MEEGEAVLYDSINIEYKKKISYFKTIAAMYVSSKKSVSVGHHPVQLLKYTTMWMMIQKHQGERET